MEQWSITISNKVGIISQFDSSEIQFVLGSEQREGVHTVRGEGVAARHAWVWISARGLQVEDLAGGTLVNGESIPERVQVGYPAQIGIGEITFFIEFKIPKPEPSTAESPLIPSQLTNNQDHSDNSILALASVDSSLEPTQESSNSNPNSNDLPQDLKTKDPGHSNLVLLCGLLACATLALAIFFLRRPVSLQDKANHRAYPQEPATGLKEDATRQKNNSPDQSDAGFDFLDHGRAIRYKHLHGLKERLLQQGLVVELDESNGIVRLPETLLFEPGKSYLQAAGRSALSIIAKEMLPIVKLGNPDSLVKWEAIYIEGHTDNLPIKTSEFASNWELSTSRAINTFKALTACEPELERIRNHEGKSLVGISGYGEQRPIAENVTQQGRAANRRIDIRFVIAMPSEQEIKKKLRRE